MDSNNYNIPEHVMLGSGENLFDHIVSCLADFIKKKNLTGEPLPLGFTFSFPCKQEGLSKARLTSWAKGFKCSGVENEDVVELLSRAIKKRNEFEIDMCAVLNDTTGCLMSCAWYKRDCFIAGIFGMGCNACYMEELDQIQTYDGPKVEPKQMIVNTELGAFGEHGHLDFLRTEYDFEVDKNSIDPGIHVYEKMISILYTAEIVRLVLVDLFNKQAIFTSSKLRKLRERKSFTLGHMLAIESDPKNVIDKTRHILETEIEMKNITDEDCHNVKYVCKMVSTRAAHLAAAAISTLINKLKLNKVTVALDGVLIRSHPYFQDEMDAKIREFIDSGLNFELMVSEDGAGRGAALVAVVAKHTMQ